MIAEEQPTAAARELTSEKQRVPLTGAPEDRGEILTAFVSNMAESSRTASTLILDTLEEVLAHARFPGELHHTLNTLHRNTWRLVRESEQAKELLSLELASTDLRVQPHDNFCLIRSVVDRVRRSALWNGVSLNFEFESDAFVTSMTTLGLSRVVTNMLEYVLRHTPEGGEVQLRLRSDDSEASICVSSAAAQVRQEDVDLCLDCMWNPSSAFWSEAIGLTLARVLVDRHGGRFDAKAYDLGGLELVASLTEGSLSGLAFADQAEAHGFPPAEKDAGAVKVNPDAPSILVIDDCRDMRAMISEQMAPGYRVRESADAEDGVTKALLERPDVIVCELVLPGLQCGEMLKRLKGHPATAEIPVIVVSGRTSSTLKVQSLKNGASAYLLKPFSVSELEAKISNLLAMRKREQDALGLARDAELRMLRYQLNPHFFFNSLNAIRALVLTDAHRAREMVTQLSEYLRYSLLSGHKLVVSLSEEIESVRNYLYIEKIRFDEDLDLEIEIEPGAGACKVPSVIVQPLVENAIKYGLMTSAMPLRVRVSGALEGGTLTILVANTGRLAPGGKELPGGTGIGLDNLRRRLGKLYPQRHEFVLREENGWVIAMLQLSGIDHA